MSSTAHALAQKVWDYHQLNHTLVPSDGLFVLCSNDLRVAEYAAELYLQGYAPWIAFSGGVGALTEGLFDCSEAEVFAAVAQDMGVPKEAIYIEPASTNTGENIRFTRTLLEDKGLSAERLILVQKPFMERRAYATCQRLWPEQAVIVTSPRISLDDYPNESLTYAEVINVMVGDLQRVMDYPQKGFSVKQDVPIDVLSAYEKLVGLGFDGHLIQS